MRHLLTPHRHPELVSGSIVPFTRSQRRQAQPHRQVAPLWVLAIDQIDLPRPVPVLELLFTRDRGDHVAVNLEVYEAVNGVFLGKTGQSTLAVLPHPAQQIGRHADVQRAVVPAREDVGAGDPLLPHKPECAAKWTLKQVQGDEEGVGLDYSLAISTVRSPSSSPSPTPTQSRHAELVSASIVPQTRRVVYQSPSASLALEGATS